MSRRTTSSSLLAVATVGASYAVVKFAERNEIDQRAAAVFGQSLGHKADVAMAAGTDLGSVYAIAGITTALVATGRWRAGLDVAASGGIAWAVAQGMKPLADRQRPYEVDGADLLVHPPAGSSWPSGHAAVAGAVGTVLAEHLRPGWRSGASAFAVYVPISRIYVGAHYLSDVVGGVAIGNISARLWQRLAALIGLRG